MPDRPPTRKTRKSLLVRTYTVLLALVALLFGTVLALGLATQRRWRQTEAAIRASGEPLTLEEVLAARPVLSPEEDGGPVIHAALEELGQLAREDDVRAFTKDCSFGSPLRWNVACVERARGLLDAHRSVLDNLAKLLDYPQSRLSIDYWSSSPMGFPAFGPHESLLRQLRTLLAANALVASLDGEFDQALRSLELLQRLADAMYEEPALLARYFALGADAVAVQVAVAVIQPREPPENFYKELQALCADAARPRPMRMVLLGERATTLNLLDTLQPGAVSSMTMTTLPPWYYIPGVRAVFLNENRTTVARHFESLIVTSDGATQELWRTAQREEKNLQQINSFNKLAGLLTPSMTGWILSEILVTAESRCAVVALAAEQYRLANGDYPQELSDLVPAYLTALPADPFDDNPLRVKHEENGALVIYSIGRNEQDDDGTIDSTSGPPIDVGFRLLPPEQRSLPMPE